MGQALEFSAGLFNPRLALYYSSEVEHFIKLLSGGRSSGDVFHDMTSNIF